MPRKCPRWFRNEKRKKRKRKKGKGRKRRGDSTSIYVIYIL